MRLGEMLGLTWEDLDLDGPGGSGGLHIRRNLVEVKAMVPTFTAMIEGVRERAIASGLSTPAAFDAGIQALYRSTEPDGVFCYTFFKAVAVRKE